MMTPREMALADLASDLKEAGFDVAASRTRVLVTPGDRAKEYVDRVHQSGFITVPSNSDPDVWVVTPEFAVPEPA